MTTKRLTIIDLFCGCGGFSLGAARAGFVLKGAIDNDPQAIAAHQINFKNCSHIEADLSQITSAQLRKHIDLDRESMMGIIGGPPCQGFSSIGRRERLDPRNGLFVLFFRIVSELRPIFFVSENVPGILHKEYDSLRKSAFRYINREYCLLPPMKLRASDYGAPTSRLRVFFFGFRKNLPIDLTSASFLPPAGICHINVGDALKGLPRRIRDDWQNESDGWRRVGKSCSGPFGEHLFGKIPPGIGDANAILRLREEKRVSGCLGTKHIQDVIDRFKSVRPGCQDKISKALRLDLQGFCPTLRAGTGKERGSFQAVRPIHPTEDRVVTPREAARLQGFPDWFQFDSTKWHSFRQIGNSVSPILAEYILSIIRQAIERIVK